MVSSGCPLKPCILNPKPGILNPRPINSNVERTLRGQARPRHVHGVGADGDLVCSRAEVDVGNFQGRIALAWKGIRAFGV